MKEPEKVDISIQQKMLAEMHEKDIFELAQKYAFNYVDTAFERNVYPTKQALDNLKNFEEMLPEESTDSKTILDTLHEFGAPASVINIGGRYFGFVNGSAIPAALATKWLTDIWDQNTALQVISPIAAKLEEVVEKWLCQLFNLPDDTAAGFVSGTSMAVFCGLAAARYRLYQNLGWDVNQKGLVNAPKIRMVAGKQIHATVKKAIAALGLGLENIEWVDVDDQGRILPENMPELDHTTMVLLQAGNVNSGAFDDFEIICNKAQKANAWVHIDGAFGLWAEACDKLKYLTRGMEKANSWSVDGHKTLNAPYDSGIVLCADREALVTALQASGAYIVYSNQRDGMLYTPEMSRRARIVELWAAIKYLGKTGMNEMIFELHQRALQFAKELKTEGFEILNDVVFNQVLVACENDSLTEKTLTNVQELRECWCGGSSWFGRKVIRVSVCSWMTTQADVSRVVRTFVKARKLVEVNENLPH